MGDILKQNTKITFSAILSALATIFMLLSYFPYLTYAIPAISGLLIMICVIEINPKWALLCYISSSVLVFLLAEPESRMMYIFFFGYYPIVKALIEKINNSIIEWLIKLLVFNAAMILIYYVLAFVFTISFEDFGEWGRYGALIFLAIGNIVFVLYDIAISRIAVTYMKLLHPKVIKIFKL